eukprot:m.83077 g.83077  ORF g.83077 m.83077 type:complete len:129 (+) comp50800_c0_seq9:523-909(+)
MNSRSQTNILQLLCHNHSLDIKNNVAGLKKVATDQTKLETVLKQSDQEMLARSALLFGICSAMWIITSNQVRMVTQYHNWSTQTSSQNDAKMEKSTRSELLRLINSRPKILLLKSFDILQYDEAHRIV